MAVLYRLSQNKMSTSKAYGKWFAQAVMTGTIDTDALAEIMQRNCTVQEAPKNDVDTAKPATAGGNGGSNHSGDNPGEGD